MRFAGSPPMRCVILPPLVTDAVFSENIHQMKPNRFKHFYALTAFNSICKQE